MPNKMLIDASHPEETRVVVVRGNRIEEFDFESQDKKQLRGNIYLARVTRVEPSLQAAFVEYGGNRHGFLAFSEIHPDYYQIPMADRQALLRADAEAAEEEEEDEEGRGGDRGRRRRRGSRNRDRNGNEPRQSASGDEAEIADENQHSVAEHADTDASRPEADAIAPVLNDSGWGDTDAAASAADVSLGDAPVEAPQSTADVTLPVQAADASSSDAEAVPQEAGENQAAQSDDRDGEERGSSGSMAASVDADVVSEAVEDGATETARGVVEEVPASSAEEGEVESVGAEDALEEVRNRRKPPRRHYKIQEVIKRRQILLVQVVKEERGNKGAALTTYLSLAGRYSVLMPNTARGGGISRKITSAQDRKRLKEVMQDLDVPEGMGVILRTAGENRTKAEIKRDYEYLMRLWENVRTLTLQSTAPALVYEEGSLIKRSVRDLYNKDIEEILVAGEEGYREAKDFMRMLMPSHAKMVQPYRDSTPILARNGIEAQLDKMLLPQVTLKSGGYIIINQTEALVAIDVNSGRSTREHSIEDTALQTNLEAAEEVARQLRLRDLAGLIVIDFIDMEENRNNRSVEKRLKDHLKNDRARIQVGRISHFGLLEMSRQRIRASVMDSTMKPCPHCGGTGHVRSDSSVALLVVRAIEEFLLKDSRSHITVKTPNATAMYLLNHKRSTLVELERRFGVTITLEGDETVGAQHYVIVRGAIAEKPVGFVESQMLANYDEPEATDDEIAEPEDEGTGDSNVMVGSDADEDATLRPSDGERDRKRRRRRRRRGGRDREQDGFAAAQGGGDSVLGSDEADSDEEDDEAGVGPEGEDGETSGTELSEVGSDDADRKRRRRGKRGGRRNRSENEGGEAPLDARVTVDEPASGDPVEAVISASVRPALEETEAELAAEPQAAEPAAQVAPAKRPARRSRAKKPAADSVPIEAASADMSVSDAGAAPDDADASGGSPLDGTALDGISVAPPPEPSGTVLRPLEPGDAKESESSNGGGRSGSGGPVSEPVVSSSVADAATTEDKPKRAGWWQRKSFF